MRGQIDTGTEQLRGTSKPKPSSATRAQTRAQTRATFAALVNLSPGELSAWLETPQSRSVGFTRPGETESVGRQAGRAILTILAKTESALTDADYAHMRKTIGFVRRHRAQRPRGDVSYTRWRYALMNWGHDPLQEEYER